MRREERGGGYAGYENVNEAERLWVDLRFLDKMTLDLNSSVSETYGRRERIASAARPLGASVSKLMLGEE